MYAQEDAACTDVGEDAAVEVSQMAIHARVDALMSGLVAALVPRTRPNHCYLAYPTAWEGRGYGEGGGWEWLPVRCKYGTKGRTRDSSRFYWTWVGLQKWWHIRQIKVVCILKDFSMPLIMWWKKVAVEWPFTTKVVPNPMRAVTPFWWRWKMKLSKCGWFESWRLWPSSNKLPCIILLLFFFLRN